MSSYRILRVIGTLCLVSWISTTAWAAQYSNERLGRAMPMWTENFPDLNHAGDAVWTGWGGNLGASAWLLSADCRVYRWRL